jgi:hypothetical protein
LLWSRYEATLPRVLLAAVLIWYPINYWRTFLRAPASAPGA